MKGQTMPSNIVTVNGQEFIVPDSWMPVLWAYLQLMQCQIGQPNPNYGVQVEATQPSTQLQSLSAHLGQSKKDRSLEIGNCEGNSRPDKS